MAPTTNRLGRRLGLRHKLFNALDLSVTFVMQLQVFIDVAGTNLISQACGSFETPRSTLLVSLDLATGTESSWISRRWSRANILFERCSFTFTLSKLAMT